MGDKTVASKMPLSRMFKLAKLIRCSALDEANLKSQIFKKLFALMKRVKCLEVGYCTCAALQMIDGT